MCDPPLKVGDRVLAGKGEYEGQCGTVVRLLNKPYVWKCKVEYSYYVQVQFDGDAPITPKTGYWLASKFTKIQPAQE